MGECRAAWRFGVSVREYRDFEAGYHRPIWGGQKRWTNRRSRVHSVHRAMSDAWRRSGGCARWPYSTLNRDSMGRCSLRDSDGVRDQLASIVEAEAASCSFLGLTLGSDEGRLTPAISAPPNAMPVVRELTASF
jgi:hypothetical protein